MEDKNGTQPSRLGRKELAAIISERLSNREMGHRDFIALVGCLMDLRGWRGEARGRRRGTKDRVPRKPGRWPVKEPDPASELHEMVAELEGKRKGVN